SREQLVEWFDVDDVGASPARFDMDKLKWMNGEYIRALSDADLALRLTPFLVSAGLVGNPPSEAERLLVAAVAPLVKTRIERLDEAAALVAGIFRDVDPEPAVADKVLAQPFVPSLLAAALSALGALESWDRDSIEASLRAVVGELGIKPRQAFVPFYVAVLGSNVGAPIFDSMALIGRDRVLERLEKAAAGGS
ncbi:MAG TPA: glutamate--tRNA ligase, partial [Actinomycetota bacterium]|nr:glutamate--tRNA ligase [Actinomycetota bacterium]